jgi:hypothetical protein
MKQKMKARPPMRAGFIFSFYERAEDLIIGVPESASTTYRVSRPT